MYTSTLTERRIAAAKAITAKEITDRKANQLRLQLAAAKVAASAGDAEAAKAVVLLERAIRFL